jgi:hypothetical protein
MEKIARDREVDRAERTFFANERGYEPSAELISPVPGILRA